MNVPGTGRGAHRRSDALGLQASRAHERDGFAPHGRAQRVVVFALAQCLPSETGRSHAPRTKTGLLRSSAKAKLEAHGGIRGDFVDHGLDLSSVGLS